MKYGIKVFTSKEVQGNIESIYEEKTVGLQRMKRHGIGGFDVVPFRVPHNETECDGWLIEHDEFGRLLFITDAEYCPKNFSNMGINYALVECNYSEDYVVEAENRRHVLLGHMELQTCKRLIRSLDSASLRSVGLLHLSSSNGDPERFKREVREIVDCDVDVWVAEEGFETELSLDPF